MQILNEKVLTDILDYNCLKYPQTSSDEKNKEIAEIIVARNDLQDPKNDLLFKSNVKFELKESQNYNSEIMQFLNYIIDLINSKNY